jgi:hypothetical protein
VTSGLDLPPERMLDKSAEILDVDVHAAVGGIFRAPEIL